MPLDLWVPKRLTARDREHLATISTRLRVEARHDDLRAWRPGDGHLQHHSGVGDCSFRALAKRQPARHGVSLRRGLFGLSRGGRYINTVHALTPLTLLRIPLAALKTMLLRNPELQLHFLCKVTQALRESQRHAILVGCESPAWRACRAS